jgi:hypothetical protein
MPWESERNIRSLSPHGLKEAEGHAARGLHDVSCVTGREMGPGLLSMTPLGAGVSSPCMPQPAGRGDPKARR